MSSEFYEFKKWLRANDGLYATDPWNMRDLYETVLNGAIIGESEKFEICVLRLQAAGRKAAHTWGDEPKWTDTFFEMGVNTTWYDDIEMQIMCSGVSMCDNFWIGTTLPTQEQIHSVKERHK